MQIYLVTGANRGIGRGLVASLLLHPSTTVIAAVRDPTSPSSESLSTLPRSPDSRLLIIKIDSSVPTDPQTTIAALTTTHNVTHIDILIANAGMYLSMNSVLSTTPTELSSTFSINAIAPLLLFQAAWPLLQKSRNPKFIAMSSDMASIGQMNPAPGLAYGVSKAALDYVVKKVHVEHEAVTAVALHPGWVQTDMGNRSARLWRKESAPVTLEESVEGCLKQIHNATRDDCTGILLYDGSKIAW